MLIPALGNREKYILNQCRKTENICLLIMNIERYDNVIF